MLEILFSSIVLISVSRQESYISRERAYKMRIDELEEELNEQRQAKTGWMKTDPKVKLTKYIISFAVLNCHFL